MKRNKSKLKIKSAGSGEMGTTQPKVILDVKSGRSTILEIKGNVGPISMLCPSMKLDIKKIRIDRQGNVGIGS